MSDTTYIVCGCKSWNRKVFDEHMTSLPGTWHFVGKKEELKKGLLEKLKPRYVFFLHWSWKVPSEIWKTCECINFHMADVPYGRGGSPLQNLILRGHKTTKLSALRMTEEMDAGPVYLKEAMGLEGTAQEILVRSSELAARLIDRIIREHPVPKEQEGKPVIFERRTPEQSRMPAGLSLETQYDFIRMLDGEGYPAAFLESGGMRYEFRKAVLYNGRLEAQITALPLSASDS
ncbi:MAG TPA: methionyl-tRNA formyltransferase [Candidatus Peribacter riflensis]|uniref:Methionyl-tRNA formyltransferase n=1 Tax=Candidatus Peribacter riflensis TaxID=1735162 RepID=A0A0S1SL94_9BACT|nr:MAG: methionyl-tRNA formyltransferase [Candidatus Peribacter riflensis]OGJ78486.1 MAG: methionyl-tRNA formyltransferase [Candidatus Peribacteria bacterium RIFOXYB1_FULL_57_12]OGJ82270.1 MAG: methionyl-tRNA formyltransferase [Candidatus Peribacteria bacterium RIFOXYC1_FULL_58_8]ALM11425.1 MAG: methionyl-tRNA formyltransferase [Candidatus Peribacter riflensis]ALM12527.1 MAG: methionyl-tRNA formyltransferase [Candidatus Peribacter riflensis]